MATSTPNAANVVTKFQADYFREFVREARFAFITGPLAGNSPAPIMIHQDRKTVSFPLITALKDGGVSGSSTLDGNESVMSDYAFTTTPTYHRQGIRLNAEEREKPAFDQMSAARPLLMDWSMEKARDDTIEAFAMIDDVNYAASSEAQRDTFLGNNLDRFLFGSLLSNTSTTDHSASLANIDSTNDLMSPDVIGIAKRLAGRASARIRPWKIKSKGIREMFVLLVGTYAFRDLMANATVIANLQQARERAKSNPLWEPGDIVIDNVLVREIPEITLNLTEADTNTDPRYPSNGLSTAGNGSIAVEPCFLLGAQAIAFALGQKPEVKTDNLKDYGFQPGVAVEMKHQIKKVIYNGSQHGMVTIYVSGVADS